jgi:hypothetical protein
VGCARAISFLPEWNRFALASDVDLEARRTGGDRQVLIAELTDDVEGLARRLL